MNNASSFAVRAGLALLLGALVPACSSTSTQGTAAFSAPLGLAVAGTDHDRLFIANSGEDSIQVGTLGTTLSAFKLMRSEAITFPLRIPAGPNPQQLAATPDGRFVLVLDGVGEELQLIDAVNLVPARYTSDGDVISIPVGAPGSSPSALVASPAACAAPCVGAFFVALEGSGEVVRLEVQDVAGAISLVATQTYHVGGTPATLAVHPTQPFLFVGDGMESKVARLDLTSGLVTESVDIGDTASTLAVSQDGSDLLVGRPAWRDVLLYSGAGSSLAALDANPIFGPAPQCLATCGAPAGSRCEGSHPADLAVCHAPACTATPGHPCPPGDALSQTAAGPYTAVYLGSVPVRIVALGVGTPLTVTCSTVERDYTQFAAVAGLDGEVRFVGLQEASGEPGIVPGLVLSDFCAGPTLTTIHPTNWATVTPDPYTPDHYLAACPSAPPLARFQCVTAAVAEGAPQAGVVLEPGSGGSGSWTFDWEGVLVTSEVGGRLGEDGVTFSTLGIASGAQAGDLLVITSTPRASCASHSVEFPITEVATSGDRTVLTLDPPVSTDPAMSPPTPVSADCFVDPANLAYKIRTQANFLVRGPSGILGRLAPGDAVGPNGVIGRTQGLLFALQDGDALKSAGLLVRDQAFGFSINDTSAPLLAAAPTQTDGTVGFGQVPGDMLFVNLAGDGPALFLSYAGATPGVVGFLPFVAADFGDAKKYLHVQR
jgi:hypothetical protein